MKGLSTIQKIIIICVAVVVVTSSVTLGCVFGIEPTVTLDYGYNEGGRIIYYPKVESLETVRYSSYSPPRPSRDGYSFQGWYKDSALTKAWVNGSDKVKSDITLYAKWQEINP